MNTQARIHELLERWQALFRSGEPAIPEELCRECPDLLQAFRTAIEKLTRAEKGRLWSVTQVEPDAWTAGAVPVTGHAYRLKKWLGEGGFGEVWEARGARDIPVALKRVRLQSIAGNFELRALDLLKQLRHAHLVSIHGAWLITRDGSHVEDPAIADWLIIAMDLAEGTLLDRWKKAHASGGVGIPFGELIESMEEAAKALDYLANAQLFYNGKQGRAVQHGDVKPQNLLLSGGSVKVADFGLAQMLCHTVTGHDGGSSPEYTPPEVWMGDVSVYSDQYSLAVAYCFLRGGKHPFSGCRSELKEKHLNNRPDLTMLTQAEREPVGVALSKEPRHRWPTCREFIRRLEAAGAETPTAVSVHEIVNRHAPSAKLRRWGIAVDLEEPILSRFYQTQPLGYDAADELLLSERDAKMQTYCYALSHDLEPVKDLFGMRFALIPPGTVSVAGVRKRCSSSFYLSCDLVRRADWQRLTSSPTISSKSPDRLLVGLSVTRIEEVLVEASLAANASVRLPLWNNWLHALALGLVNRGDQAQYCVLSRTGPKYCYWVGNDPAPQVITNPLAESPVAFRLEST